MGLLSSLLNMVYPKPKVCLYCGATYLSSEVYGLCGNCLGQISFIDTNCQQCGRGIINNEKELCKECQTSIYYFDNARSIGIYKGLLRDIILQLKYDHYLDLKEPLIELLYIYFKYYFQSQLIDYIIPVPLHQDRLKKRGFNQAELLARGLAQKTGLPLLTGVITRVKNNPPLYDYTPEERQRFIKGSFQVEGKTKGVIENSSVLLIDDILTTGTTVNEASYILKTTAAVNDVQVMTITSARLL